MIRGRWTVESRLRRRPPIAPGGMIQMSYHDIRIISLRSRSRGNRDIHVIPPAPGQRKTQRLRDGTGPAIFLGMDTTQGIEVTLDRPNGPKITYPTTCEAEDVEAACPEGWTVDWETPHVDAGYDSARDCPRFAAPLMREVSP